MKIDRYRCLRLFILMVAIFQVNIALAHEKIKQKSASPYFSGLNSRAARVVGDFHRALQDGDATAVRALLAEDVVIFEGGGVERSAGQYAASHMKADIAFLQHVRATVLEHHVRVNGNTALSISISTMRGRHEDRDIDMRSMETLVLEKRDGHWQIVHIHWSN